MTATVRPIKTHAELALAEAFSAAKQALPGDGNVAAWREAAFERFATSGLPHRRVEAWKYTDLRALLRDVKPLASPPSMWSRSITPTVLPASISAMAAARPVKPPPTITQS